MKFNMAFAVVAFGAYIISVPAAADPMRLAQDARLLPAYEIRTIVRSAGLDPIGPVRLRGRAYVLRAFDDDDREVRVMVDARYGEVLSVAPITALPVPPGRRFATVPPTDDGPGVIYDLPELDDEMPPANSTRTAPRLRSAPLTLSRRPPLPQPRPPEASLVSTTGSIPAAAPGPAAKQGPVTEAATAVNAKPAKEPEKREVKVPPVAPLDPHNKTQIPN